MNTFFISLILSLQLILAAGSLTPEVPFRPSTAPDLTTKSNSHTLDERASSSYIVYSGNGEVSDGWPPQSDWVSTFSVMFKANFPVMNSSCAQFDAPNNSNDEISNLQSSIETVGNSSKVDPRFILAIVMEESNGCVRAPSTANSVSNPGLMQSHNGTGTCNSGGRIQNPCPASEITQMIEDGTEGTISGDGLEQLLTKIGVTDVSMYYKAARMYNSGSVAATGNLGQGGSTHCYASDIANRLTGWATGLSGCNASQIGDLSGTVGASSSASSESSTITVVATPSVVTKSPGTPSPPAGTSMATISSEGLPIGSSCSIEGEWNCVAASYFQQCASGSWSVVQQLAAGTECSIGQSSAIAISAATLR